MNAHRTLHVPRIELLVIGLLLLVAAALATLASVAWLVIHLPTVPTPVQRDPVQLVRSFHEAVNSNDVDAMLSLFTEDATIRDRGSVFHGGDEIRHWALGLQRAGGLSLSMMDLRAAGGKIYWRDMAVNGTGMQPGAYILESQAVVEEGKINSLAISLLPPPDRK